MAAEKRTGASGAAKGADAMDMAAALRDFRAKGWV